MAWSPASSLAQHWSCSRWTSRVCDRLDRAVLDVLCRRFGGGPVGVSTLAVAVGEERETVEEVAEPFLVRQGLLARTPRGTSGHSRRRGPTSGSPDPQAQREIDPTPVRVGVRLRQ